LAWQDGEGDLGIGRAQEDGGNGIKEGLRDAGGEDDAGHMEGGETVVHELG